MSDNERLEKGLQMMETVYAGIVPMPADQVDKPMNTLALTNLFADVWGRDAMTVRDRRLIIIGAIAAMADSSLIEIQIKAALKLGELKPEQLQEIPLILTQYIGYPRTVPIMRVLDTLLEEMHEHISPTD